VKIKYIFKKYILIHLRDKQEKYSNRYDHYQTKSTSRHKQPAIHFKYHISHINNRSAFCVREPFPSMQWKHPGINDNKKYKGYLVKVMGSISRRCCTNIILAVAMIPADSLSLRSTLIGFRPGLYAYGSFNKQMMIIGLNQRGR
jgi:hypothetical protein